MSAAVDNSGLSMLHPTAPAPAVSKHPTLRGVRSPSSAVVEQRTDVPSARPTSAPDFDMAALAVTCLQHRSFAVPMDLFVPVRTAASIERLEHRDAFLLFHVDGESTLAAIADHATLSIGEVVSAFHRLAAMGIVEMTEAPPEGLRAPQSGVFSRVSASGEGD